MAAVVFLLGSVLLVTDYLHSRSGMSAELVRNDYGKGSRSESLKVQVEDGEKSEVQVEISEREYTSKEVQEVFRRCIRQMEQIILGDNESPDRVESDLNLVTKMPGEPIDISWETDRYDVVSVNGELKKEHLAPEGTKVMLRAVLTYEKNRREQAQYECAVMVCPPGKNKAEPVSMLENVIRETEERTRNKKVLKLPENLDGKKVHYYPRMEERGIVLMVMALLTGILLFALDIQNETKEQQKRKRQMLMDYPEIINKLTLFLGAGMTVKRAWRRIVQDYEAQESVWGKRYAYEEMKKTCYEMDSGITESESYVRFGRRCSLQEYVRMGALLSQNLRRGTKGLSQILRLEALQALEERKARARQLGEEAGTKLLVPMFLMLAVVLVMVVVPAFLSFQM